MIKVIKASVLKEDELALVLSMQGIINRKEKIIYIDKENYMDYLSGDFDYISLNDLLINYRSYFEGYVLYNFSNEDVSINIAATISAAYDVFGLPRSLESLVSKFNYKKLYDLNELKGNYIERQRKVFEYLKPHLNKDGIVHQVVRRDNFLITLRDYSISNRWPCIYTKNDEEGKSFLKEVLNYLDKNIAIFGWNDNELDFVEIASKFGDYVIPSDWSMNHSFFREKEEFVKQKYQPSIVEKDKHYLAIVMSDGDNIQWLERDFRTTSTFGERERSPINYKINWTISPSINRLNHECLRLIYNSNKNNYFISSVSGIGYANPLTYPKDRLKTFAFNSSEAMKKSDLEYLCLLDNINNLKDNYADILFEYTKHGYIKGGVWEMDPDRYLAGKGKIFYSKDKIPFVSVRFSFWPKEGNKSLVTKEWLDEFANNINSMKIDPKSEDGYSVLNINPWTTTISQLNYLVTKLDSHIELVYVNEMIDLIRKNCG